MSLIKGSIQMALVYWFLLQCVGMHLDTLVILSLYLVHQESESRYGKV